MPIQLNPAIESKKYELRKTMVKFGGKGTFVSIRRINQSIVEYVDEMFVKSVTITAGQDSISARYTPEEILMFIALSLMDGCNIKNSAIEGSPDMFTFLTGMSSVTEKNILAWTRLPELVRDEIIELCITHNPEILSMYSGASYG